MLPHNHRQLSQQVQTICLASGASVLSVASCKMVPPSSRLELVRVPTGLRKDMSLPLLRPLQANSPSPLCESPAGGDERKKETMKQTTINKTMKERGNYLENALKTN